MAVPNSGQAADHQLRLRHIPFATPYLEGGRIAMTITTRAVTVPFTNCRCGGNQGQRYSSLLPNSNRPAARRERLAVFRLCVSQEQLQGIINEINRQFDFDFSTNPDNYALLLFGIGPEKCSRREAGTHVDEGQRRVGST
jgi:hypothetical protein